MVTRHNRNKVRKMEKAMVKVYIGFGQSETVEKNLWMCRECGRVWETRSDARGCEHCETMERNRDLVRIEKVD